MKIKDIKALASLQGPARSTAERLSRKCYSVEDMRKLAAKRLPKSIFEYIEGGGEDEVSLRRNRSSFDDWSFLPKWGSVDNLDLSITILGGPSAMPVTLSPTGGTRLFHPEGESAVARAALTAGIPYGLAHLSTTTMEAVSAAAPGLRRWFNLEPTSDKGLLQAVLDRVSNAGYEALLVNVDCRAIGHRERDYRNGFTAPPSIKPKTVVEGMLHPAWALGFLANDAIAFPNLDADIPEGPLASSPDMWRTLLAGSYEPTDWDDIRDLRERWNGPIVLKGVVNANDAALAASMGIDAIQVSNHGGRQLDHMAAPLDVLPEIVAKTAGRMEIIVDGGIRRGSDVVKALALGADACSIGRPYLYGLAASGQAGVEHVLKMITAEMTRTMMLLGVSTIEELRAEGRDLIRHRNEAFARNQPTRIPEAPLALQK
ncbi:alpha-hydroxy acid oxidase [Paenarthrobacter nitroguajacolicus]|uniref:alpha-hydroxy acid oxidase n=1 Tax=Paenarthrobacter nitroguajacolicus TaxID=211146 RepID=UPI00286002BA|nr:alpha-hydroxy acid oxidase [Paenarthrobacter nitroguajacolicus]MDR6640162.1 L-lactate dehydrogenase (cytochrome) [Paenarthrobacter nitroguajacolicus]